MKSIIYILLVCTMFGSCSAQKNGRGKIYAYRQAVLQGKRPDMIADEKGREVEQQINAQANYHIYVESADANLQVKGMWIKKVPYSATLERVTTTPVVMTSSVLINSEPDTLVKATSNKVFRIHQGPDASAPKLSSALQKKISQNELVVHCIVNGKDYYYTLAVIKNLPPVALQ